MKRFIVSIEKDSDGSYIAYNLNGEGYVLIGRGKSVTEAKKEFADSMAEVAESEMERKGFVPEILTTEPEYKFSLSSLFEYYSMLNVSAFARFVGINETLMHQYKKGNTYISDKQLLKIEEGLHKLGKDFSGLRLV
ncbi:MAG: hypothetical protein LUI04_00955 [Porphyromonadaceae bacterium]|nr:hypothetical protein [Porphyromonadaceae bacterium]